MLTGIDFFDKEIVEGGFQEGSIILVAGEPGTGKTIFSSQIIYNTMKEQNKPCIYVSLSEGKQDYFKEMKSLGMDFEELEKKGLFKFIDLISVEREATEKEIELIMKTVMDTSPKFVIIDSVSALIQLLGAEKTRIFLHTTLGRFIKAIGSIAILIAEKPYGEEKIGYGIEEFVVDGVIVLRMEKVKEANRRVLEIRKMRGRSIKRPQYEFTITSEGIKFLEVPELIMEERVGSTKRVTTGISQLDEIMGGGVFEDSITLIAGQTGTGKTSICLYFVIKNALEGKNTVFISFEEPPSNLIRQAKVYGLDIAKVLDKRLKIYSWVPEAQTPVDYFIKIKEIIEKENPGALVIDSLTSIQQKMDENELVKFLRYLQLFVRAKRIPTFITLFLGSVKEGEIPTTRVSTLADNAILLKYEMRDDKISRKLIIVKTRGSEHSQEVHDFYISSRGIKIE
ncbi:MAG: ATPase domain-containing protein [Candidatus Asgardarchaeia archaeon]